MADDKVLKPKSFRIDDETADKFKEISAAIGGNQQETLAKLIEAFEFQSGKAILTEKKADIDQFEKYVTAITRMYMGSLEDNQNITETVRTEFDALLKSKDSTIQDLQEKLTVAKQLKEEATTRAKAYADENVRLNSVIDSLNTKYNSKMDDMQSMLADKDNLNKALTDSCNDLKSKVESIREAAEQLTDAKKSLADLQSKYDKLLDTYNTLQADLSKQKATNDQILTDVKKQAKFDLDKAVFDLDKRYQEQIQSLQADKQAEIDKYQQKYFNLLESMKLNQENDNAE